MSPQHYDPFPSWSTLRPSHSAGVWAHFTSQMTPDIISINTDLSMYPTPEPDCEHCVVLGDEGWLGDNEWDDVTGLLMTSDYLDPNNSTKVANANIIAARATSTYMRHSPKARASWERRQKCVELRVKGLAWDQIARMLSYDSPEGAKASYTWAMKSRTGESVEDRRQLMLLRLELLTGAVWDQAEGGDLDAIDRFLKIGTMESKIAGYEKAPMPNPNPDVEIAKAAEAAQVIPAIEYVHDFLKMLPEMIALTRQPEAMGRPELGGDTFGTHVVVDSVDGESAETIIESDSSWDVD